MTDSAEKTAGAVDFSDRLNGDGLVKSEGYMETMNRFVLPFLRERRQVVEVSGAAENIRLEHDAVAALLGKLLDDLVLLRELGKELTILLLVCLRLRQFHLGYNVLQLLFHHA